MSAAPVARPRQQFRPPLVSLIYSGCWWAVAIYLYLTGQRGWEWGTLLAIGAAGVAISQIVKAVNDKFKERGHRRKVKMFEKGTQEHGSSRFATTEDLAESDIMNDKQGIFLGTISSGVTFFTRDSQPLQSAEHRHDTPLSPALPA